MDEESAQFMRTARRFLDDLHSQLDDTSDELTELGRAVEEFLGVPVAGVEPVVEEFPPHQVVDLDIALEKLLATHDGRQYGVSGSNRAHVESLSDLLMRRHSPFRVGPVTYTRMPTGPGSSRRVVSYGLAMLRFGGTPVVVLQRGQMPHYGRDTHTIEVLATDSQVSDQLIAEIRATMRTGSIMRGQVITFQRDDFDYEASGGLVTFLARPQLDADRVILPDGVLDRVSRHVIGIGQQRDRLTAAGQHLKRGVLLYGPPGTGKTHLVRHLLSETPGTTAVLLSGRTLASLSEATKLARAAQPAIVVLEDCDLVAEERGGDSNAVLFETLEAMDGLDGDADITFILTTNRPDLLERALVERPGRVDLAVEISKPDLAGRQRLLALYAADLIRNGNLSETTIQTAAERTEGTTASFAKEAVRRCILVAAREDRPPADDDLATALTEMLSDAELLTRTLLGGVPTTGAMPWPDRPDPWASEDDLDEEDED